MNANDIVFETVRVLDKLGIPYMLVGSYSSNFHGIPRATQDADFVLQLSDQPVSAITRLLGHEFQLDPQMSFESVTSTCRYIVTHRHSDFKVELFLLSSDPHDQQRFARRTKVVFEGRTILVPTAEDVVITKLRWSKQGNRRKDVDDVVAVLSVQAGALDLAYIRQWADVHGTRELFEQLLASSVQ